MGLRGRASRDWVAVAVAAAALLAVAACTGGPARVPDRSQGDPHPHPELARKAQPTEPLLENVRQLSFAGRRSGEGYFGPASRPASRPGSGPGAAPTPALSPNPFSGVSRPSPFSATIVVHTRAPAPDAHAVYRLDHLFRDG